MQKRWLIMFYRRNAQCRKSKVTKLSSFPSSTWSRCVFVPPAVFLPTPVAVCESPPDVFPPLDPSLPAPATHDIPVAIPGTRLKNTLSF